MHVAVLGASGATGRHLLEVAADRGVTVTAVVRDRSRLPAVPDLVTVAEAALSDVSALAEALSGVDAVLSTLGVARRTPADPPSRQLPHVLEAMGRAGVHRFVGISGAGLTLHGEHKPLSGRVASWFVRRAAPAAHDDKVAEYDHLRASPVAWTLVRAPRLVDGPPSGRIAVGSDRPPAFTVTRGDVALFMLGQVRDDTFVRRAPMIATARR